MGGTWGSIATDIYSMCAGTIICIECMVSVLSGVCSVSCEEDQMCIGLALAEVGHADGNAL